MARHVKDESMADLRKILIDDIEVDVDPNLTILQACGSAKRY